MTEPNVDPPPLPLWKHVLHTIRQRFGRGNASETRLRTRRALRSLISRNVNSMNLALFFVGYVWMLIIPLPRLGRGTYIDENAIQPGQVTTNWNWGDVHAADIHLQHLELLRDTNATSHQRAQFFMTEFRKLGISASSQDYRFQMGMGQKTGTNAYGVLSSPRSSGTEAMVISASWLSRTGEGDGTLNLRGVATLLALAGFLKRYSLWAKDIVFVISDGYLDGLHAWLSAYHDSPQSKLIADHLTLSSGVIWTALHIDYPGHSFSHLGMFFEGLNGRLPNQDLLNSFQRISLGFGVPVVLYDHLNAPPDTHLLNSPLIPTPIRQSPEFRAYVYQAKSVIRHIGYQARGRSSGAHGLYHRFRIDAFTLFGVPASGPHGFHAIGRIIESTLRSTNNLLERLHASFFFYIITGPDRFLKIGNYLPSAVLISIAMMFSGLKVWVDSAWAVSHVPADKHAAQLTWLRRRRPVLGALAIIVLTHILGALLFAVLTSPRVIQHHEVTSPLIFALFTGTPIFAIFILPVQIPDNLSAVLKSLNLCLASTVISITTVLNFSLAALLAILLGVPLSASSAGGPITIRLTKFLSYMVLGIGWLLFGQDEILKAIRDWEMFSVWFAPFICLIYVPLVLQAGFVCLFPS